jgi:cysteine desulfurase
LFPPEAAVNRSSLLYLDHNATTPIDPRVLEAMLPWLREGYGNPSSPHAAGARARAAVERAREQAAALLGSSPECIVFGSGGTEAANHAVFGAARLGAASGRRELVISAVEHPAVSGPCRDLERAGFVTRVAGVDRECRVDAANAAAMLGAATALVSVMLANNETGALQPVAAIAAAAGRAGALSHTDAAQAVGKIPVSMRDLGVDLLSVAGHKLYAPKGVGLLCVRPGLELPNLMFGAGHEGGRRPGTENVAAIVGLGMACGIAGRDLAGEWARQAALRDELQGLLCAAIPAAQVHAAAAARLPNTLSIGFPGTTGAAILAHLPEVAASAGAACHGSSGGSAVLAAMGVAPELARGTLRLSLGRGTTAADVPRAAAAVALAVARARAGA